MRTFQSMLKIVFLVCGFQHQGTGPSLRKRVTTHSYAKKNPNSTSSQLWFHHAHDEKNKSLDYMQVL